MVLAFSDMGLSLVICTSFGSCLRIVFSSLDLSLLVCCLLFVPFVVGSESSRKALRSSIRVEADLQYIIANRGTKLVGCTIS